MQAETNDLRPHRIWAQVGISLFSELAPRIGERHPLHLRLANTIRLDRTVLPELGGSKLNVLVDEIECTIQCGQVLLGGARNVPTPKSLQVNEELSAQPLLFLELKHHASCA